MFDQSEREPQGYSVADSRREKVLSLRKMRKARKLGRAQQNNSKAQLQRKKVLSKGRSVSLSSSAGDAGLRRSAIGPTPETLAKLRPDPLVELQKRHILSEPQVWAFCRIRRAIHLITNGTQVRVSHISDVVVQSSRRPGHEGHQEIRLKDQYSAWVDRMTAAHLQVGPVLDIILEELSLTAVDRKWRRRKGWAKRHLQAALNLYGAGY